MSAYLHARGEVDGAFHRDAMYGVEHLSKVIRGGDEHARNLARQAKHPHAVLGVGLRLGTREEVYGICLCL